MSGWQPDRYDPSQHQRHQQGQPLQRIQQQQPPPQAYWPQPGYAQPPAQPPRRRRRVFMWVFLAVQALFIIWIIAGIATTHNDAANCHDQYLTRQQCADATAAGGAIGVGLIVAFWCIVDFLMAVTYLIVRVSRRRA